jgi:type II secretory pathway component PulK
MWLRQVTTMRKAQGISINVLIVVVLALLVIAILASIMINKLGVFSRDTGECSQRGGQCAVECGVGDAAATPIRVSASCAEPGTVCCIG